MTAAGHAEAGPRKLRILLIAYEFPPSPSPQSLRWGYLSNRLAAMGHEVHVLAPDIGGSMEGLPGQEPGVSVHRTWPGPVRALLGTLARRRPASPTLDPASSQPDGWPPQDGETCMFLQPPAPVEPPRLNWKGHVLEHLQAAISRVLFPDLRGEWRRPAKKALGRLLDDLRPDIVISSHEPATTLQLGLVAKRRGFRWVADLGDPVLAPYTPLKWRGRAASLEAATVQGADHVLVTAAQTQELLRTRYGAATPITVVTQGFDELLASDGFTSRDPAAPLELLYAGSFYSFRDPGPLVDAVLSVEGVRLNIAARNVPEFLEAAARNHPAQVRLLGRVPHRRLLALQRQADLLVNLANADSTQVPGKFYEYLGAGRPVLHVLAGVEMDATGMLLQDLRRGWACGGERHSIAAALVQFAERHRTGGTSLGLDLDAGRVTSWSWTSSARTVAATLEGVVSSQ